MTPWIPLAAAVRVGCGALLAAGPWQGASFPALPHEPSGGTRDLLPPAARVAGPFQSSSAERAANWEDLFSRLKLYGDFRLRHESDFRNDQPDRHRERLRLRMGVNYQLSDEVLLGMRVVTGDPEDPNSPHVTLGDGFDKFELNFDRAFLTYRPAALEGSWFTAGKFSHPFYQNPVYGELVWDADIQPEGVALGKRISGSGSWKGLDVTLGGYSVVEQARDSDAFEWVSQVSSDVPMPEGMSSRLAVGYYLLSDATPDDATTLLGENGGNATVDQDGDGAPDDFLSQFGVLDAIGTVTFQREDSPLVLAGEFILNTRADQDQDQGWAIGFSYGSSARKGDWRLDYQWQVVEQDAVFSPFSQDDFLFATNHKSHLLGGTYQLTEHVGIHLWTLVSSLDDPGGASDDEEWRLRLDLDAKL